MFKTSPKDFLDKFPLAKESLSSLRELIRNNPGLTDQILELSMCIGIRSYQIYLEKYKDTEKLDRVLNELKDIKYPPFTGTVYDIQEP